MLNLEGKNRVVEYPINIKKMLIGKAKLDFELWLLKDDISLGYIRVSETGSVPLFSAKEFVLHAKIVEWFRDVVFFHLQVYPYGNKINWCYNITDWKKDPDLWFYDRLSSLKLKEDRENDMYNSYEEALKEAIKKANEIYNTTHV